MVSYSGKLWGPIKLKSRIISFGITEYYMENGKLMSKDKFCFSDYKANLPFQSKTSDEFTRAIKPRPVEMEIMETNGEIFIHRPETPTLLGVSLKKYTDSFPTDPKDPRWNDPQYQLGSILSWEDLEQPQFNSFLQSSISSNHTPLLSLF